MGRMGFAEYSSFDGLGLATLFRLAAQLEAAHPWSNRRPPVHADALA